MNYDEIPIIQLKNVLEKEEWFKLANGYITIDIDEMTWKSTNNFPRVATLSIFYKVVECKVDIYNNRGKFQMRVVSPNYCTGRSKRTASIPKAFRHIRESLIEVTEKIDSEILREEEAEKQKKIEIQRRDEIIKKLGVAITANPNNEFALTFKMSKDHRLVFSYYNKPGNDAFYIMSLTGEYGLESIKKLIDYLSECTEAVADRLLNGK